MNLKLKIWRQRDPNTRGKFVNYKLKDVSPDSSFLEMLDVLNEELVSKNEEPVVFDHDCREGICGACGMYINGRPHGPDSLITVCQLHMRKFKDGDTIVIEPWRARAFPLIRDLMVDRSAFDSLIEESGYVSVNTGSAPDANSIPVAKKFADLSMDAAACIGCGACVAACPNASAALFVGAKISQYSLLPQGQPEAKRRVAQMVAQMDEEYFGSCSNHAECEAVCPKEIPITAIARMRREYWKALAG
jgi:succinate dehydrogenase / fumarate reductase iron-sulfur subunit